MHLLLEAEGIVAAQTSEAGEADLVYARENPNPVQTHIGAGRCVWIPATDVSWDSDDLAVTVSNGLPCVGAPPDVVSADLLLSAYHFSTGYWERDSPRNDFGVPLARGSSMWEAGLLQRPAVAPVAGKLRIALQQHLDARNQTLQTVERWPHGKRWTIALTHDVDRPLSKPPAAHYRKKLAKHASGFELLGLARTAAGYLRNATLTGDAGANPEADPQFGFDGWMDVARQLGLRSAFYVAVRGSSDEHGQHNDVYYDARMPAIRDALTRAVDDGFEVGLHASIACRSSVELFAQEKAALEEVLGGQQVVGNRHHYWALDATKPVETLRAHGVAGFQYDSSLGLNDAPGFRRGIAWPFRVFDPATSSELSVLQVPPTVMDAGVYFYEAGDSEHRRAVLREHLDAVAEARGCAVINWHLAQIVDDRMNGAGPALREELTARASSDSEIWWTTPREIATWWDLRRSRVFPR